MSEQAKILLVEDDANLGFVVKDNLEDSGYVVDLQIDGELALEAFQKGEYDICVLDVMLPKKDGFTLAEDIRSFHPDIPIIFLTAKSLKEDKVKGFKLGADDYITKPFSIEELTLRIQAILKRSRPQQVAITQDKTIFQLGNYTFDAKNLILQHPNETRNLTAKEAQLLHFFIQHQNNVVERSAILNSLWGDDDYFTGRSLDVFISRLRKYLKADSRIELANVHGVGFKLKVEN